MKRTLILLAGLFVANIAHEETHLETECRNTLSDCTFGNMGSR